MDETDKKWYEDQFDLFSSPGYKALVEKAKEIAENIDTVKGISSESVLWYHKGQLVNLEWFIGWQSAVESSYKELTNEDAA